MIPDPENVRDSLRLAGGRTLSGVCDSGGILYKFDPEAGEDHKIEFFDICVFLMVNKPKSNAGTILAARTKKIPETDGKLSKNDILSVKQSAYEFIQYCRALDAPDIPEEYENLVRIDERGAVHIDYQAVAQYLLRAFHCISYVGGGDGDDGLDNAANASADLYVYDPDTGIYSRDASALKARINDVCKSVGYTGSVTTITREILHYVSYDDPKRVYPFNAGDNKIPVLNGVLELHFDKTPHRLIEHNPENRYTYFLPVRYDPEADPGPIHDILSQYVSSDDIDYLYQIPAQTILQGFCDVSNPYKTAYLIQGPAHGGKSTYHDLLVIRFFTERFTAKESLQRLCGGNNFATSSLPGKFMNTYDDLDDMGSLANIGDFKTLIGSFAHSVEAKMCRRKTEKVSCVHLFTCNRPPLLENKRIKTDRAWWERWVYLKFRDNDFEIDPEFQNKNFTPDNLSGFLNEVLEFVVKIKNDSTAFMRMDVDTVLDNWSTTSDPLRSYIAMCFYSSKEGTMVKYDKARLLESYKEFCKAMGIDDVHGIQTVEKLSRRLFDLEFKSGRGKNSEYVYEAPLIWQGMNEENVALLKINPTHRDKRITTLF